MTKKKEDRCLLCNSNIGYTTKKAKLNIVHDVDEIVDMVTCNNCGYIYMFNPHKR